MNTYVHQKERQYRKQPNHPLTIEWIGYCVFIQWDTPLQRERTTWINLTDILTHWSKKKKATSKRVNILYLYEVQNRQKYCFILHGGG